MGEIRLSKRFWIFSGILAGLALMTALSIVVVVLSVRRARSPDSTLFLSKTSFATFGDGSWWAEDEDTILVGWPRSVAPTPEPAFIALIHWPKTVPADRLSTEFKTSSENNGPPAGTNNDWEAEIKGTFTLADGRKIVASYHATGDPKKPTETFEVDGKVLNPAEGRLFLIDLTGPNLALVQLSSDLKSVVPEPDPDSRNTYHDPKPALKVTLAKLRERHPEVRKFLENSNLK